MPWPTPMHMVAAPRRPPRRRISCSSVVVILAPEQPSGWPIAIAPPLTLTVSGSSLSSSMHGDCLGRERLVDLGQLQVVDAASRLGRAPWSWRGPGRCPCSRGVRRPRGARVPGERLAPSRGQRSLGHQQQAGGAVVERGGVAAGDRAAVPEGGLAWRPSSSASGRRLMPSSAVTVAAAGASTGDELVGEPARVPGGGRPLVAAQRELVLQHAGDAVLGRRRSRPSRPA